METTVIPDTYNPNALVQYKVIDGDNVTFPITKVTDLEWVLENARQRTSEYYSLRNKVDGLEEQIIGGLILTMIKKKLFVCYANTLVLIHLSKLL